MAIQDSFNVSRALDSQSYAYKCWYNYNYGGNTMRISADDMNSITQNWSGELVNWKANAESDENAYEIEDDDFNTAVDSGKNNAQEKTGYEGGGGGKMIANASGDIVLGGASAVLSTGALNSVGHYAIGNIGSGLVEKSAEKALEKGVETSAKVAKSGENSGSWIVGAPLTLATATKYMAQKPNKDQKEACDALQDEMLNAQSSVYSA